MRQHARTVWCRTWGGVTHLREMRLSQNVSESEEAFHGQDMRGDDFIQLVSKAPRPQRSQLGVSGSRHSVNINGTYI